jgi:hypothetical protein
MKQIPLSRQGKHKNKFFALVDDEDYEELSKYKWHAYIKHNTIYARRNLKCGKKIKMHRWIMKVKANEFVDHKDRNGLNNKRDNLRVCTLSQNNANRKSSGKVKYLGVHIQKVTSKGKTYFYYRASITHNNCGIYIGIFDNAEEAAMAYDKAAIKYHKEFARLNFGRLCDG